ncbi:hypothetical protein ACFUIY_05315 [Streptomyces griseorubiginosus]|nr:hypothetical protein [Streptomyces griseorubiginosus]
MRHLAEYARDVATACEPFTTDEPETVIRFLDVTTDQQRQAAARLAD